MKDIITIDDIKMAIDNDKGSNKLHDLAELLYDAMCDWPTTNQNLISEFVKELYDYYGFPLTKEKIEKKKFDMKNNWKHESGASIHKMIEISIQAYKDSEFESILNRIIEYYKNNNTIT